MDGDLGDDPFGESRVDATLTQVLFGASVGSADSTGGSPAGAEGVVSSPGLQSEGGAEAGHVAPKPARQPPIAFRRHCDIWRGSLELTTIGLEEVGKDRCLKKPHTHSKGALAYSGSPRFPSCQ